MDDSQPLPMLSRAKTCRVRGPRPCSWISSSPLNEQQEIWPWVIMGGPELSCGSTVRSTSSSESSDSSWDSSTSSSSSSPLHTPSTLFEFDEKPYSHRTRRRKPVGPRAPLHTSYFDLRPRLAIDTSLPAASQLQREASPTPPVKSIEKVQSPQIPPLPFSTPTPTNFPLDWDAIFEILACSDPYPTDPRNW